MLVGEQIIKMMIKKMSLFDNIIDLLYNLFQPISILVIAGLMYLRL